jgi:integrase/recombinase XerD
MFETLFTYAKAVRRHREGPSADAREQYLRYCANYGAAQATLSRIASELLVIAERIDITPGKMITLQDIKQAGQRWARYQQKRARARTTKWSAERFVQVAIAFLRFLGCFKEPCRQPDAFASQVEDFVSHLRDERGLSANTIQGRRWHVQRFLETVTVSKGSLAELTIEDVDRFLGSKGTQGWCRVSVATSVKALRCFFRHAEMRGWCSPGIATTIDGPRLFRHEGLPRGPTWQDVQRIIVTTTTGSGSRDIRDRAILMLLATYGLRSGEVRKLCLEDLDWAREVIIIKRPKQRRTQYYPLVTAVGDAILRYLQKARPHCVHREIFLTLRAPFRPLSSSCVHHVVSSRLEVLGISVPCRGPHGLRHACASHLVAAGLSLKEIGDHLGHTSAYATRLYAKVDLAGLRQVADFDLRGLS